MTLDVRPLAIPGLKLIAPRRFADARGYFAETWNRKTFRAAGIDADFCQDNQSLSRAVGTVRGLHFQNPPHAQAKLVGVLAGRIFDVAVDLRTASPTFGKHAAVELSAANGAQLFVPAGFAHGFCTLEPDTVVAYKVDAHYAPEADAGIFWADDALGIAWPVTGDKAQLSPKDAALPLLEDLVNPF
ncbi:MAG: dTDP-4-dehydrorhamnose 3,5-epimerase [Alphaproteobacteria bacterium]|nr:dTDP-4-dehydrorhamnose 3,5-epimerase [Alphaproteobacteria bacterium]